MGILDMLGGPGGLVGGVGSIIGTIGAADAARQAANARNQAVNAYQMAGLQGLEGGYLNDQRNEYGAAGLGSDAILQGSRNLGASLAAGGVYNPSVVAGSGLQQQLGLNSALANLGAQNRFNEQQGLAGLNQNVANMRLGIANQDWQNALGQQAYARQGLQSFLGNLAQNNLARSGANAQRIGLPAIPGTVNQNANLPGNTPPALDYPMGGTSAYGQGGSYESSGFPGMSRAPITPPQYAPPSQQPFPGYRPFSSIAGSALAGR